MSDRIVDFDFTGGGFLVCGWGEVNSALLAVVEGEGS